MNLFARLVQSARLVHPDPGPRDLVWRVKYCLRGLAFPRATSEWFRLLDTPKFAVVARNHPHIFSKLQRVYLDRFLSVPQRLERLQSHYRFLSQEFSDEMVEQAYGPRGLQLASIALPEIGHFTLRLLYFEFLGKEGELSISLHDESSGLAMFALSFCVTKFSATRREIFVGGLQAFNFFNEKERIVAITRAMHGLRPKALLVFVLQQLATNWDFRALLAVSDANHVYRHFLRRKTLAACYDEFWKECGGQLTSDGAFALPVTFNHRDLTPLTPSKRQMYRRRYAMLQELAREIQTSLPRPRIRTAEPGAPHSTPVVVGVLSQVPS